MRRVLFALVLALGAGTACTEEEALIRSNPYSEQAPTGWTPSLESDVREAFFDGYGPQDAFGTCAIDYIIDTYSPSELETMSGTAGADEDLIREALNECVRHIN